MGVLEVPNNQSHPEWVGIPDGVRRAVVASRLRLHGLQGADIAEIVFHAHHDAIDEEAASMPTQADAAALAEEAEQRPLLTPETPPGWSSRRIFADLR